MNERLFSGTFAIFCFILRRDRLRAPLWLFALTATSLAVALSFVDLYASAEERQAVAQTMVNPATTALIGQGHGLDDYTYGAMLAHQMLGMTALTAGVMSILLVIRHTRAQEEDGQLELLGALPVGRLAVPGAALLYVSGLNILIALFTGAGLTVLQLESITAGSSFLYGAAIGTAGIFFAALTLFVSQAAESSRGALGLSVTGLVAFYGLRAVGDTVNETFLYATPFGWLQEMQVYVEDHALYLFLPVAAAVIFAFSALQLHRRRDAGAGMLPARAGRRDGGRFLTSVFSLVFRLQRTSWMFWALGMILLGAVYGSVLSETETFFAEVEIIQVLIAAEGDTALIDQFLAMFMSVLAVAASIPTLLSLLRLKSEEKRGRLEALYTLPVPRLRVYGVYVATGMITSIIMLTAAAAGLWGAAAVTMEESFTFGAVFTAALVFVPALAVMLGLAALILGVSPALSPLIWVYLLYGYIVIYMGELFQFPDGMDYTTPYGYVPEYPAEDVAALPLVGMVTAAVIFAALGAWLYRRRDLD
ncbi:ABC-2 type transport system permease protein [Salsuginibacillus halophilus]|uniref:ABC-2 type transport system permease protein n=1 Tax=Salsuginibacillus halophilus TaxID=517424 RepID=A0A2P8HAN7_9BACI|nr:ABC transporter permease [Salsuginibacillus halophilus]PSL43295.1 ABC-2 type transport system permease protein [Salsuginibacillus halophilus]